MINDEKEILMKKNVPVEQMLKYLGYENLTREMLKKYVQGIYVYDDGEWRRNGKSEIKKGHADIFLDRYAYTPSII